MVVRSPQSGCPKVDHNYLWGLTLHDAVGSESIQVRSVARFGEGVGTKIIKGNNYFFVFELIDIV